jgi:hypothetical protein
MRLSARDKGKTMPIASGNDLILGLDGKRRFVRMSQEQRARHLYVVGGTGMGKSRLLTSLIQQDIEQWRKSRCGLLLIDLHGELYDQVMGWLTDMRHVYRERPIIPFDMRANDYVVGYNLLRQRGGEASTTIDALVEAIAYAQGQDSANETPRFKRIASAALHALYAHGAGLTEIYDVLAPDNHALREVLMQKLPRTAADGLAFLNCLQRGEYLSTIESTMNRVQQFLGNANVARMLGQTDKTLDFRQALDDGAIVLASLATAGSKTSRADSKMMATVMLSDLWTAAHERGKSMVKGKPPKPFYVYLDEFQHFVTPTIAENLDEARGFGLHLTLANQYPSQLLNEGERGKKLYGSVMNNVQSKVVMGLQDPLEREPLVRWLFEGAVDTEAVKFEINTKGVVGETETTRRVVTTGENNSSANGGSETTGNSASTGTQTGYSGSLGHSFQEQRDNDERYSFMAQGDPDDRPYAWQTSETENNSAGESSSETESQSSTTSWSSTTGSSRSESHVPFVERHWGEQLSSRTFRTVDEQLFQHGQKVFRLKRRQAIIRLADNFVPMAMTTSNVPDVRGSSDSLTAYRLKMLQQWGFVQSRAEAQAAIDQRQQTWVDDLLKQSQQEPETFSNRRATPKQTDG